jgi:hypothetical protein
MPITMKDGIYGAERDGARARISFANRFAKTRGIGQRTLLSHPTRWYRPADAARNCHHRSPDR